MQNRSMFPYRRHGGAKKRAKNGPMRNKGRGGHRPLPNSARDLLPLLQPATKALAQVLAGHSQASGQLNHARNLLAHAERLVAERSHNRLNPREREDLFEQLARLKLTLADAEVEAEVQALEGQAPPQPVAPPVGRERLLEMALALGSSDREPPYGSPRAVAASADETRGASPQTADADAAIARDGDYGRRGQGNGDVGSVDASPGVADASKGNAADAGPRVPRSGKRSERLVLMAKRPAAEGNGRETSAPAGPPPGEAEPLPTKTGENKDEASAIDESVSEAASEGDAAAPQRPRRQRKTTKGLPEGWVVDDEGFVVPGPS
jgi:hypothetical protein